MLDSKPNVTADEIGMIRDFDFSKDIDAVLSMDRLFPKNQQIPTGMLKYDLHRSRSWVYEAKHSHRVVGVLISTMEGMPYVYSVSVEPEYRGKFIATRLMNKFLQEYDKYSYTHLHTDNQNPAQTMYFRLGFRVVDVEEDYYGDQTTGLHMIRYKV